MPSLHRSASLCHRYLLHSEPKEYFAMHMSRLQKTVKHFCGIQVSCFKFWVPWVWDGSQQVGNLRLIVLLQHFRWGTAAQTVVRRVILEKRKKKKKEWLRGNFWLRQMPETTDHTYINPMSRHSHGHWRKETLLRNSFGKNEEVGRLQTSALRGMQ